MRTKERTAMLRLDKYIAEASGFSRKEASEAIRKGRVTVNGKTVSLPQKKTDEKQDEVTLDGNALSYKKFTYIMLHKPAGYVSSTDDPSGPTVLELLPGSLRRGLFPCGRLDKNTTGLLILTNDGVLTHKLLSPAKHVEKTYAFTCKKAVTEEDLKELESGVDIGGCRTKPCKVVLQGQTAGTITLTEGKYHQIKLMFQNRCNKILSLHRLSFGGVLLDSTLSEGAYRALTAQEEGILRQEL